MTEKICSFCGHHTVPKYEIENMVENAITVLIEKHSITTFYSEGAGAFDKLCQKNRHTRLEPVSGAKQVRLLTFPSAFAILIVKIGFGKKKMIEAITNLDFQILDFIQTHMRCAFLDAVMPLFTTLGNGGFLWLLLTGILLCLKTHRRRGAMLFGGLAAGFVVVNLLLKPLCARPRPSWLVDVPLLIANPTDFSFPSGHTASSFIAAFLLTAYRPRLGFIAIPAATLMAFSRLYLYVHFPSDVLGAVLLSGLIALGISRAARIYDTRKEKNK